MQFGVIALLAVSGRWLQIVSVLLLLLIVFGSVASTNLLWHLGRLEMKTVVTAEIARLVGQGRSIGAEVGIVVSVARHVQLVL